MRSSIFSSRREYESGPRRPHPVIPEPKPVKEGPDFIVEGYSVGVRLYFREVIL